MKKIKVLFLASMVIMMSSCGYYSCPTYTKAEPVKEEPVQLHQERS